jgi:hypothetical protein
MLLGAFIFEEGKCTYSNISEATLPLLSKVINPSEFAYSSVFLVSFLTHPSHLKFKIDKIEIIITQDSN